MKKNPKTSSIASDAIGQTPDSNGSFAVGFLLGAVGAAAGMWFVKTEQGHKVYQALKKEFLDEVVPAILPKDSPQSASETPKAQWGNKFPKFGSRKEK